MSRFSSVRNVKRIHAENFVMSTNKKNAIAVVKPASKKSDVVVKAITAAPTTVAVVAKTLSVHNKRHAITQAIVLADGLGRKLTIEQLASLTGIKAGTLADGGSVATHAWYYSADRPQCNKPAFSTSKSGLVELVSAANAPTYKSSPITDDVMLKAIKALAKR